MRAVVYRRYGPPEVLRLEEVERPTPGDDEVLVKVHATTVNRTDCAFRKPEPFFVRLFNGWRQPKRQILGTELAGEIAAAGAAVTAFAVGDRVFGVTTDTFGAHAEFVRQNPLLVLVTRLLRGQRVIVPIPRFSQQDVVLLRALIEAGRYRAVIDRAYPLEQVVEATRYVETEQKTGNVVLTVTGDA